jgi:hypothetical protein
MWLASGEGGAEGPPTTPEGWEEYCRENPGSCGHAIVRWEEPLASGPEQAFADADFLLGAWSWRGLAKDVFKFGRSLRIVGSRRAPVRNAPYQAVRNSPEVIGGRTYTGHALDQMQNRGLVPSVVENTITHGQKSAGNLIGTTRYYDPVNNVSVVVDTATGRVITVY